jgi:hypothetical protein
LLKTLDDTSSQNPYFSGGSGFFTEVATEEQETSCRSDGVDWKDGNYIISIAKSATL